MIETVPSSTEAAEKWEIQLRKGSLELAILAALWGGRLYGLEILRHLETHSDLIVVEGTVYPLLNRLRALGLIESEWVESTSGHPRKYYRLTQNGRQRAIDMRLVWNKFAASMNHLLEPLSEVETAQYEGREHHDSDRNVSEDRRNVSQIAAQGTARTAR